MTGAQIKEALVLLANIAIAWKGLPGMNAPTYFVSSSLTQNKLKL
jgi:hypothetical protein